MSVNKLGLSIGWVCLEGVYDNRCVGSLTFATRTNAS